MTDAHPVDRANDLREAEIRELVADRLFACAELLAELGETFAAGELRDEAEFQAAEARDIRARSSQPIPKKGER